MRTTDSSEFKHNVSLYMKTIWLRLPVLFLVGTIQIQHAGFFHYVGYVFFAWALLELAFYFYRKKSGRK